MRLPKVFDKLLRIREESQYVLHDNENLERIGIFVSIPKNASQTILKMLELGPNRDIDNTSSLVIHENHQRLSILNQKYDLNNLFVFCFVRNPYDRCISWYKYHKQIKPYSLLTYESWIREGLPHHWTVQNKTNYLAEDITPLLQYDFIENHKIDAIGKIENFSTDMMVVIDILNRICREKGLTHRFQYTDIRQNTSNGVLRRDGYHNTEIKEIIYWLLQKDFQYFGYEK